MAQLLHIFHTCIELPHGIISLGASWSTLFTFISCSGNWFWGGFRIFFILHFFLQLSLLKPNIPSAGSLVISKCKWHVLILMVDLMFELTNIHKCIVFALWFNSTVGYSFEIQFTMSSENQLGAELSLLKNCKLCNVIMRYKTYSTHFVTGHTCDSKHALWILLLSRKPKEETLKNISGKGRTSDLCMYVYLYYYSHWNNMSWIMKHLVLRLDVQNEHDMFQKDQSQHKREQFRQGSSYE